MIRNYIKLFKIHNRILTHNRTWNIQRFVWNIIKSYYLTKKGGASEKKREKKMKEKKLAGYFLKPT